MCGPRLSFPFIIIFFFFVSCLLARWQRKVGVVGSCRGRGLVGFQQNSVLVAVEGWDETGAGSRLLCSNERCFFLVGYPGATGARPGEVVGLCSRLEKP